MNGKLRALKGINKIIIGILLLMLLLGVALFAVPKTSESAKAADYTVTLNQ